jgi:ComF family protein
MFFPDICPVCERLLVKGEKHICSECLSDLPLSYFWNSRENPASVLLRGYLPMQRVSTLMIYRKESRWKNVLYEFKYSGNKHIGRYLAQILTEKLKCGGNLESIDVIIPVPLHPLKRWKRGFNQAAVIAGEISRISGIPVNDNLLRRGRYSVSQTLKDKGERSKGVKGAFFVKDGHKIAGKHILLVDDVLTTGATAGECGSLLMEAGDVKLSFAALAFVE